MYVVAPASRLRRGVRRLALTLCALILGAGFSPALPQSTVDRPVPPVAAASVAALAGAPSGVRRSSAGVPASMQSDPVFPQAVGHAARTVAAVVVVVLDGVTAGVVAGRAPPSTSA
ncbi:hypothetical protein OHA72_15055 [Dactylosporangium sp. NBC_01737]|uniref:hypothetical protein n=1 Tax=Dactylosporangium sp. NBC_01737 TaxID=2975959 RepID=UPI002E101B1E|nr:hypothetical protein OHA72_15055 [Dactylosporangium sp. NBC_01737]